MRRLICLLLVLLTGCALRMPGTVPVGRDVPLTLSVSRPQHVAAGSETTLRVRLGSPYRTLAVPSGWDRAELALGNPALLTSTRSATVTQAGGETASAVFTGLRPGGGYTLSVELYAGGTLKASGRNAGFVLTPGNQEITVSLTLAGGYSRIQSVAHTFVPAAGTSATAFSLEQPSLVSVGPDGHLYVVTQYPAIVYRRSPAGLLSYVGGGQDEGDFGAAAVNALDARLRGPAGLAVDTAGNVYVAEADIHRIRRIAPNGTIRVVAGTGSGGFSGDGGPAVEAELNRPGALAFDSSGNLYVADQDNCRVRRIGPDGVITTVAGNGELAAGADGTPADGGAIGWVSGLALGPDGLLYLANDNDYKVRKIDADGLLQTVAGNGAWGIDGDGGPATAASLSGLGGMAFDAAGNLYLSDYSGHVVRRIATSGIITRFAGGGAPAEIGDGGAATDALLSEPRGLAVDAAGNVYVADDYHHRVRQIDPGGTIRTVAGNGYQSFSGDGGQATNAQLHSPRGVAVAADGTIYIADGTNHRIRKVTPEGLVSTLAGTGTSGYNGDGIAAVSAQLSSPRHLALDTDGNLIVCDTSNARIRKIDLATGLISTLAGNGTPGYSGDGSAATDAELSDSVRGVAYDPQGNLYIADSGNLRVRMVDLAGVITTLAGSGNEDWDTPDGNAGDDGPPLLAAFGGLRDVTVDPAGRVVVATGNLVRAIDRAANRITRLAGTGTAGFSGDGGAATDAQLDWTVGVRYDSQGNLFIADSDNYRIRKVDPSGVITTVAGAGIEGFGGDGGSPLLAKFDYMIALGIDSRDRLFIVDWDSYHIRMVD